jgi:hypothetical protein
MAAPVAAVHQVSGADRSFSTCNHEVVSEPMDDDLRVERGWIIVKATRDDDGRVVRGQGEMRFSPFDALRDRAEAGIPPGAILKASVQRLAFWRR